VTVTVKLHASLKKFAPAGASDARTTLELPDGATARDAVRALGIPDKFAGAVFLGTERAELSSPLRDGEDVNLFPPIGGG
jgi:molybdopterin converting factor small subunit